MSDSTSQRDYWDHIRSTAEEIAQAVRDGELTEDEIHDRIHEETDGSWWIIYNHAALAVCQHTDNEDAYQDLGELPTDRGFWGIVTCVASWAMAQDLAERVYRELEENSEPQGVTPE